MTKLSKQDKIDIYNTWKYYGKTSNQLAKVYNTDTSYISYLIMLIDRYGSRILNRSYTNYSIEFKEQAINRVLINNESFRMVLLDLACQISKTKIRPMTTNNT